MPADSKTLIEKIGTLPAERIAEIEDLYGSPEISGHECVFHLSAHSRRHL